MIRPLIAATLACAMASPVAAQPNASTTNASTWPTRPVTLVVPFPAGGPVDLVARLFAQRLSEKLGQQIITENIGGAGGMSGSARVAKAAPDGSVMLFGNEALSQVVVYRGSTTALRHDGLRQVVADNSLPFRTAHGVFDGRGFAAELVLGACINGSLV